MIENKGGSAPLYLNKVNCDKKALELDAILRHCRPTHPQRLWLVGFLKFCGYSMPEVLEIIHEHNQWTDYNPRTTAYQVGTVYHQRPQSTQNHSTSRPRKWDLRATEILRIRYQRAVTLNKILSEENKGNIPFPHPERLINPDFNPGAQFLRK